VRNFYKVLGIAATVDDKRIKSAFRRRAKSVHPDLNPGDKRAEQRFKELTQAYEVLRKTRARASYDAFLAERRSKVRRRVAGSAALMLSTFALTMGSAYLLLALGAQPGPPVRLSVPSTRLIHQAVVAVGLESADGAPHRVRLRALTPRGLNALEPEQPVEVPATGRVEAPLRVLRAGAPAGSRAGIVLLAGEVDGPLERTAVATADVEVAADRPWLPRLRAPLLALALALLASAVLIELRRLWLGPAA